MTGASPALSNCKLWDDQSGEICVEDASPTVTYSDVQGDHPGTGNIDADPRFRALPGFDHLLARDSPCVGAGDPAIEDQVCDRHPRWPC